MREKKDNVMNETIAFARRTLEEADSPEEELLLCETFESSEYEAYLQEPMPERLRDEFERHCMDCRSCLRGLYLQYQKMTLDVSPAEIECFYNKTRNLMDTLDREDGSQEEQPSAGKEKKE